MSAQLNLVSPPSTAHSSTVEMWLHSALNKIPVLQSSPTQIKLNDAEAVDRGDALLEIIVDGRSHRHPIRVIGPVPGTNWVSIVDR
jgi:hypothetical protein